MILQDPFMLLVLLSLAASIAINCYRLITGSDPGQRRTGALSQADLRRWAMASIIGLVAIGTIVLIMSTALVPPNLARLIIPIAVIVAIGSTLWSWRQPRNPLE